MHNGSKLSIFQVLNQIGVQYRKVGKQYVCRCPICKGDNKREHNAQINVDSNTIYCYTENKAYTSKDLIEHFALSKEEQSEKQRKAKKIDIEKCIQKRQKNETLFNTLLQREIPHKLWNCNKESYKNIGLFSDSDEEKLIIKTSENSYVIRNRKIGNDIIKWQYFGSIRHWKRFTGQKIVFFASGTAEWLILDWLDLDYFVLRADSCFADILDHKDYLKDKIIAVLPDIDDSFSRLTNELKKNFKYVIVVNEYEKFENIKDFRDYCRHFYSKVDPQMLRPVFAEHLLELVYKSYTGDVIEREIITTDLVYEKLIAEITEREFHSEYISSEDVKPEKPDAICISYLPLAKNTVNLLVSFGGQGKTWIALNVAIHCVKEKMKVLYFSKEDPNGYLSYRLKLLKEKFYNNISTKNLYFKRDITTFEFDKLKHFDIVILDPLLSFFDGDNENDNKQARDFITKFVNFGQKYGVTILFLHHAGKKTDAEFLSRGASAFIDSARLVWEIEHLTVKTNGKKEKRKDYDISTERKLILKKDNHGILAWNIFENDFAKKGSTDFERIVRIKPAFDYDFYSCMADEKIEEIEIEETY